MPRLLRRGYFTDENPNKLENFFRDKKVIHPKELDEHTLVLLPYGASSEAISQRFSQEYKGKFIPI